MTKRTERNKSNLRSALGWLAAVLLPGLTSAGPIDLNALFHDDNAPIQIAADGTSALFNEDANISVVFLSDVPGFGDPLLVSPSLGLKLLFDYSYSESLNSADLFHFAVLNGDTGDALIAPSFNLFVNNSNSGTASFDLSSLFGSNVGIQFELVHPGNDADFSATLGISNLRLEAPTVEPPPAAIAEPSSLVLLLLGGAVLWSRRKSRSEAPISFH